MRNLRFSMSQKKKLSSRFGWESNNSIDGDIRVCEKSACRQKQQRYIYSFRNMYVCICDARTMTTLLVVYRDTRIENNLCVLHSSVMYVFCCATKSVISESARDTDGLLYQGLINLRVEDNYRVSCGACVNAGPFSSRPPLCPSWSQVGTETCGYC